MMTFIVILLVLYLVIGAGLAVFLTSAGGESIAFDKEFFKFVVAWPIMFIK